ncbi:hypothetical protein WJX72_004414 [[Myrmecia] bisecta]|uniref:SAC domain-containing protein n=1 Tax=[Myrmecia] bisecta TaxID=41462 RepID=A0AAW1QQ45_9CHLO
MAASSHPVLQKFSLYQTKTRCYLVGRTKDESQWKVLKFSRLEPIVLEASEDPSTYTRHECTALLKQVDGGNAQHGGLQLVCEAAGVIGCFRFLEGFYLLLITKKRYQGSIRGQKVYGISETALVPLCHPGSQGGGFMHAGAAAERRYRKLLLSGMELTKDFFFSYDYDIARTLQANLTAPQAGVKFAGMFVWNEYLTRPLRQTLGNERWVLPLVHGFFQQRSLSVIGRHISITLIARRSKFFAGTRYRKRGVSDQGRVANDVETEQLVSAGYDRRTGQPLLSSVVQVRGSVPLYWTQEGSTLKPDILLQHYDPLYTATRLHFQDLVARYGQPITVLNLVRSQEKRPRETILRREFATAINYLNQQAGDSACIVYRPWDFNLHAKQRGSHILAAMHDVISQCLQETGFLTLSTGQLQHGVLRSNCIDCLDRTNVAQFAYGIMALGRQLHALGISDAPDLDARSSVARQLMDMYEAMGNVLARQYGGSEAHSTFFQRERGDWEAATQSRDLLTSIRRFYSNTYTDAEKQDAINIFLGNFVPVLGQPAVWDLDSDYYLHSGLRPLPAGATAGATSSGAPSPSAQSAQSCASAQSSPAQSSAAPLQPGRSAGSQPASPAQSSMGRSSPGVSQQEDRSLMDDASSPKAEAASDGDRQAGSSDRPPKRLKLKSFDKIIGKQPNTVHHVRLHAAPTQKPYLPQWLASPLGFRATDLPFGGHPQGSPLLRAPSMSSEAPNTSEGLVVLDAPGGQPYPSASTAHLSHAERTSPSYQQSLAVEPSLSLRKTLSLDLAAIRPVHSAPQIASPPMNYPAFATERRKSPPGVKGLERSASATGPLVSLSSGPQAQARAPPRRRLTFPSMPLPFFLSKAPLTPQPRPTEPSILLPPRPATARDSTKPGSVQPKGSAAAAAADYQRRSQPPSIASFLGAATAVRAGLDDLGLPPCVQAWWSGAADPTDGWWEDEQLTLAAYQRFMGQVELQLHTTQQLELYAKYEALCSPSMHVSMGGFTDGVGSEWRQQAGLTGSRTFGEAELLNITGICG